MRILVTTTSFQDTPGAHHDVLAASGFDIVHARGSGVTWREATKYLPAAARWHVAGSWLSPSSRPARARR